MKIVLTGGGTGGHIFPCIALIPKLKTHFENIYYIGEKGGMEENIVESKTDIPFYGITCTKLVRSFTLDNLKIPFKLMSSIRQAKRILKQLLPDVVFSKGGYVSLPVVMACSSLNIPCVIHESDLTFGLANKIAMRYADLTLTTFDATAVSKKRCKCCGTPIRDEVLNAKRITVDTFDNRPKLLVTGGSMGAKSLNESIRKELKTLTAKYNIIHIVGKGNVDNHYIYSNYKQLEFTDDIGGYLKWADMVVTRGGANALMEIMALGKPCLVIPLCNKSSRGDQVQNTEYLYNLGYVERLSDTQNLVDGINYVMSNLDMYKYKLKSCTFKDGKQNIVNAILSVIDE